MPAYNSDAFSEDALVDAYNAIFAVRGASQLVGEGPHVQYVEDRVRILLAVPHDAPLNISSVCALAPDALLRLLFKAVAGDYISGPGALGGDSCRLLADQRSGSLELTRGGDNNEAVLTVISLVLLCVIGVLLYRQPAGRG